MRPHSRLYRDTTAPGTHSLALTLRHLPVAARALMVGAHPDDEDSALLAELALRHGIHTVYLCLTRGEGGQNRIGPETGAAFGILRTGELLASRQHDGAVQLLAPYIDFGYAKTGDRLTNPNLRFTLFTDCLPLFNAANRLLLCDLPGLMVLEMS